jgi:hypothetical protein
VRKEGFKEEFTAACSAEAKFSLKEQGLGFNPQHPKREKKTMVIVNTCFFELYAFIYQKYKLFICHSQKLETRQMPFFFGKWLYKLLYISLYHGLPLRSQEEETVDSHDSDGSQENSTE